MIEMWSDEGLDGSDEDEWSGSVAELPERPADFWSAWHQLNAGNDDSTALAALLDGMPHVDLCDEHEQTLLMHAARMNCLRCAQVLLERGAMVELPDKRERTALGWAGDNVAMVALLLRHGADANELDYDGHKVVDGLFRFNKVVTPTVKFLIDHGAKPGDSRLLPVMRGRERCHAAARAVMVVKGRAARDPMSLVARCVLSTRFDTAWQGSGERVHPRGRQCNIDSCKSHARAASPRLHIELCWTLLRSVCS